MRLSWEQSALAKLWRLVGSRNYIVQYYVEFYADCELTDVGVGLEPLVNCSQLNHSEFTSGKQLETNVAGLDIGQLYRGHVFAINLFGMSSEAAIIWSRHFGIPGQMDPPIVTRAGSFSLQVGPAFELPARAATPPPHQTTSFPSTAQSVYRVDFVSQWMHSAV